MCGGEVTFFKGRRLIRVGAEELIRELLGTAPGGWPTRVPEPPTREIESSGMSKEL